MEKRGEGAGKSGRRGKKSLTGARRKCNCPRFAAMAAAPSTVTLLAAESSPQEATVPAASSSFTACAAAAAAAAAVIVPASSATSTPASPPAGGCGDGGGGFGGSTMAAAGRGGSSFKVETRPCLREGEFPSRGVGATPSPSLPLQPVGDRTGRGSPPPHPPPAVAQ